MNAQLACDLFEAARLERPALDRNQPISAR
jgi:hypothetical protein